MSTVFKMSAHVTSLLAEYALGLLDGESLTSVELHLAACSVCEKELERLEMAVDRLQAIDLPQERLWGTVQRAVTGAQRFGHFAQELSALFDLSIDDVKVLLVEIEDTEKWMPGPVEGTRLFPVNVGAGLSGSMAAIVELLPGATFPDHEHLGQEKNLLLQGGYRDSSGEEFWRGEVDVKAAGTAHSFTGLPGLTCVVAVILAPFSESAETP